MSENVRNEEIASSRHTAEGIATGLAKLAANAGNARRTSAETGLAVSTLRTWRARHPELYEEAAAKIARQVETVIAREARENAILAATVERLGLERARERLERDEDKQPATTAQRAAVVKGISIDKLLTLEGRPAAIHATSTIEEDLRFLRARAIPNAEVVEEDAKVAGQLGSSDGATSEGK